MLFGSTTPWPGDDVGEVELLEGGQGRTALGIAVLRKGIQFDHRVLVIHHLFPGQVDEDVAVGVARPSKVGADLAPLLVQVTVLVSVRVGSAGLRPFELLR